MDIECRRTTTTPGGEEYVRWSGVGVRYHTGSLSSGCQSRRLGSEKQDITDGVVASDPVPVAPTANLVVSKGVRCAAALWTGVAGAVKWYSQPVPQAAAELLILQMETQGNGWHPVQPVIFNIRARIASQIYALNNYAFLAVNGMPILHLW